MGPLLTKSGMFLELRRQKVCNMTSGQINSVQAMEDRSENECQSSA